MKTLINKRRSLCENRTILDIKYYGDTTGFMEIEIYIQVLLLLRATHAQESGGTCTHHAEEDILKKPSEKRDPPKIRKGRV